jgi:hypothetical protein
MLRSSLTVMMVAVIFMAAQPQPMVGQTIAFCGLSRLAKPGGTRQTTKADRLSHHRVAGGEGLRQL